MGHIVLPGAATDYMSMADAAQQDLTADAEWRIDFAPDDWTPAAARYWCDRYVFATPDRHYRLDIQTTGTIGVTLEDGSGGFRTFSGLTWDTSGVPSDGTRVQVRVTLDADNGSTQTELKLYSRQGANIADLADNSNWTLEKTNTIAGVQSWKDVTAQVNIGLQTGGTGFFDGKFYRLINWKDLSQTTKAYDVDVDAISVTSGDDGETFAELSSNGATVTIHGTGWSYVASVFNGTAAASLALTASAVGFAEYDGTASAALALTTSADGNFESTEFNGTATASLALTASGTGDYEPAEFNATATAALALTTSAAGFVEYDGEGTAGLVLTTSADGNYEAAEFNATASADLAFDASGAGSFAPAGFDGQGSADLTLTTSGTGDYQPAEFAATAAAGLALTATGQGDAGVPTWFGEGSANLVVSASATGDYEPALFAATGSADLALTSTATGQYVPAGFTGQASASLELTASADGAFDATWSSTGSASVELTTSGVGDFEAAEYAGTGDANLVLTASATGTEGAILLFHVQIVDGPVGPQIVDGAYGPQLVSVDLSNFGG